MSQGVLICGGRVISRGASPSSALVGTSIRTAGEIPGRLPSQGFSGVAEDSTVQDYPLALP